MEQMMKLVKSPWLLAGTVLAGMSILLYQGWAFSYLWLWFATPLGLPRIDLMWACGILLVARSINFGTTTSPYQPIIAIGQYMLKKHDNGEVEKFPKELLDKLQSDVGSQFFLDLTKPLWFLAFGAIIKHFM